MTGYKATPFCPVKIEGVFPQESAPTQLCPFHNGPLQASATTDHMVPTASEPEVNDSEDPND